MKEDVLIITLDSCRYDTFKHLFDKNLIPNLKSVGQLYRAQAPSHFTYGSHASFWMGFTPGIANTRKPYLNPKAGKLFRMSHSGLPTNNQDCFTLIGKNIVDGFNNQNYTTIGTGAVEWFNPSTETGAVLGSDFKAFYFAENTWSLNNQLQWINKQLELCSPKQKVFCFLNIGETHVPYWHEGASWERWPSPCVPFGGDSCDAMESAFRQRSCLEWVDFELGPLLKRFEDSTILVCADHGDCWGEDGLWEHGISHAATLTVPLLLRVRGEPVNATQPPLANKPSPSRFRSGFSRLKRWLKAHL